MGDIGNAHKPMILNGHPRRPVIGLATLYVHDGKMLLAKRLTGKRQGWMNCPGGHFEWGETFEDCAMRESLEETSIILTRCEFLTAANGLALDEDHHYVMIYMLATEWTGEPKQTEKANGPWIWYRLDALPEKTLPTTLLALCAYYRRMTTDAAGHGSALRNQ